MIILRIIAVTILILYLGIVLWKNKDIPHSISMTYYLWPPELSWIFRATMILVPGLILPGWLDVSEDYLRFLAFLCCGGMIFVGCAPNLHIKLENKIHYTAAGICCTSGILWTLLSGFWYVTLGWIILGGIGYMWKRQPLWWIEIITMGSIITCLTII